MDIRNSLNNFLKDFLINEFESKLIVPHINKWSKGNFVKLDIILKKKDGFASSLECQKIHKLILIWIKKEQIKQKIQISVQSESINKLLFCLNDFKNNLGKKIKIELKNKIDDRKIFSGFLKEINDDIICLESDKGIVELKTDQIKKAQLMLI